MDFIIVYCYLKILVSILLLFAICAQDEHKYCKVIKFNLSFYATNS